MEEGGVTHKISEILWAHLSCNGLKTVKIFRELSMLDPEPRELYNCHQYCFSKFEYPCETRLPGSMGDPILRTDCVTQGKYVPPGLCNVVCSTKSAPIAYISFSNVFVTKVAHT